MTEEQKQSHCACLLEIKTGGCHCFPKLHICTMFLTLYGC